jgi:4-oxalocrotonate tautomerase
MPIIQVHLLEGRSGEQKKKLVSEMTGAVCSSLDVVPEQVRIILSEMSPEDYSVGGTLFSDKKK